MNKGQLENNSRRKHKPPYWTVFKACFSQCFNIFFIFFVTLALFPSVQSDIHPSDKNFVIPSQYYSSVMCFLTFNITAMLGSSIASLVQWVCKLQFYIIIFIFLYILHYIATKLWLSNIFDVYCKFYFFDWLDFYLLILLQPNRKYLVIPVVLRLAYIPLFLLCNYQPVGTNRILPVLINNDWVFWVIAITMGLSSGYLSSLSMMYCPT